MQDYTIFLQASKKTFNWTHVSIGMDDDELAFMEFLISKINSADALHGPEGGISVRLTYPDGDSQ